MSIQDEIPKSRLTLTYRTEIDGEPEAVDLPLRLLVMSDFSLGTSDDRKVDLDERRLRQLSAGNLNDIMADMNIRLQATVANKIDPKEREDLEVDIPIKSIKDFSPQNFAMLIPKLRGLVELKQCLEQVQSDISNKKGFRRLLNALYSEDRKDDFSSLKAELAGFEAHTVPEPGEDDEDGEGEGEAGEAAAEE